MSGTSASTPHVSGAAALVKAFYPTASEADVKNILSNSGTKPTTRWPALYFRHTSSINYNYNYNNNNYNNNNNIVLTRPPSTTAYFTGDTDGFPEPLLHLADGINNVALPSQRLGHDPLSHLFPSNLLSTINRQGLSFPTGSLEQQIFAQMPMLLSQAFPKSSIHVPTDLNNIIGSSSYQNSIVHIRTCEQINANANRLLALQSGASNGSVNPNDLPAIQQRLNVVSDLLRQNTC